jgi:polyhydroxyalkanoate synthase
MLEVELLSEAPARAGGARKAPKKAGNARHKPIEPAPGRYVKHKAS